MKGTPEMSNVLYTADGRAVHIGPQVVVTKSYKTNHILHLILCFLTLGLWLPVWFVIAASNSLKMRAVERKSVGKTGINWFWLFLCIIVALVLIF